MGSSTPQETTRQQNPALDGIRAIAILGVFIFHIYPPALPGGFVGVDVFFVLSGFLITSIIRNDLQNGIFSFREFYLRRGQRLLPNAAITVLTTILVSLLFFPSMLSSNGFHGLCNLLNISNFYAYRYLGDYWGAGAESAPLLHYWSLGIEEQFYIIFPFLLVAGWKISRNWRWVFLGIFGVASLSFLLCWRETVNNVGAAFYLPQFRFWELLAGAALAVNCNLFATSPPPGFSRFFRKIIQVLFMSDGSCLNFRNLFNWNWLLFLFRCNLIPRLVCAFARGRCRLPDLHRV